MAQWVKPLLTVNDNPQSRKNIFSVSLKLKISVFTLHLSFKPSSEVTRIPSAFGIN